MELFYMVIGKLAPGKLPSEKCSPENRKIATPPPSPPGKLPSMIFFVKFFLSLVFLFMRILVYKKNLFSFN